MFFIINQKKFYIRQTQLRKFKNPTIPNKIFFLWWFNFSNVYINACPNIVVYKYFLKNPKV